MDAREQIQNVVNRAERDLKRNLVTRHPELLRVDKESDIHNMQAIDRIFLENGWEFTDEDYEAAYAVALQSGELVLPEPGTVEGAEAGGVLATYASDTPRMDADGCLVDVPADESEVLAKMTTAQMREYLDKKYSKPRPANAAEFLTGAGSYRWKQAQPASGMDEEALAALRGSLKGTP